MASSFDTLATRLALAFALCATFAACAAQPTSARPSAYSSRDAALLGSPQWQSNFDDRPASLEDVTAIDARDDRDAMTLDDVVIAIDTPNGLDSSARSGSSRAPNSAGSRGTPASTQGSSRRYTQE